MRLLLLGLIFTCFPLSSAMATKVGYVNLRKALSSVGDGQAALNRLRGKKKALQRRLNKAQKALMAEKKKYDKTKTILRGAAKRRLLAKLQRKFLDLRRKYATWTRQLARAEALETRKIVAKMQPIIRTIARRYKIQLMLEMKESGILYAPSGMDFTNELVRRYDARYKGKRKIRRKRRRKR
jgi:outer membrane protein